MGVDCGRKERARGAAGGATRSGSLLFPTRGATGKTYCTVGGIVPEIGADPELRRYDADVIEQYDVPYRHLLAAVTRAFHRARLDPFAWSGRKVGVWVGHGWGSQLGAKLAASTFIEDLMLRLERMTQFAALPEAARAALRDAVIYETRASSPKRQPGGAPFLTPSAGIGLLSRVFDWRGPVMAVDAACASSFAALAQAAHALENEICEIAVVGGASYSNLHSLILFSRAQALSDSGSFPFDARANGFIGSDGYCAIVLTTLERAEAMGAPIAGVIRGIGISCDGRGKSLWAPRKEGQALAIERAGTPDLDRRMVQYVEAHATSTPLGDATELEALTDCFREMGARVPIGSESEHRSHQGSSRPFRADQSAAGDGAWRHSSFPVLRKPAGRNRLESHSVFRAHAHAAVGPNNRTAGRGEPPLIPSGSEG